MYLIRPPPIIVCFCCIYLKLKTQHQGMDHKETVGVKTRSHTNKHH